MYSSYHAVCLVNTQHHFFRNVHKDDPYNQSNNIQMDEILAYNLMSLRSNR